MIGKIYRSRFPFYSKAQHRLAFKSRPVLIIGAADFNDYNVLPISRVTLRQYLNPDYDIPLDPVTYPLLGLKAGVTSYIRVHKQSVIHAKDILSPYGDLKGNYPDMYLHILTKLEQYIRTLLDMAL